MECLPALNSSQGLTANPDISGIGVRTAIYTQAILIYLGILLSGCALLFSAIIQAKTFGLSAYHGTVVLYLSWINNTSALTFFMFVVGDQITFWQDERQQWKSGKKRVGIILRRLKSEWNAAGRRIEKQMTVLRKAQDEEYEERKKEDATQSKRYKKRLQMERTKITVWWITRMGDMANAKQPTPPKEENFLYNDWWKNIQWLHGSVSWEQTGALSQEEHDERMRGRTASRLFEFSRYRTLPKYVLGLWLWLTIQDFGMDQECLSSTNLILFNKVIPITSSVLRAGSIGVYVFSAIPLLNIAIWICLILIVPSAITLLVHFVVGKTARTFVSIHTRVFFISAVSTVLVAQILLIIFTERTIKHNHHLLNMGPQGTQEGDWTFGQTLAITLTIIPLIEIAKFLHLKTKTSKWFESWMENTTSQEAKEEKEEELSAEEMTGLPILDKGEVETIVEVGRQA
ncbi:hypothetical protein NLJ89_g9106 [Agrocybe chaxingu]|uniref:Uncharacterized protein n=1 Tax=Agrocybe chaxingu TaxID=84603 RepID=A0A9W8JWD7_9AGAR|nr:hypothetical protein NLJ89_g9106 [Agrocybe chaxingu]